MILDGEVSVLIPNPENRNFAHWLQNLHGEIKNYEKLIERETKRLQLVKERMALMQNTAGNALVRRMTKIMSNTIQGLKMPPQSMKSSKILTQF